MHNDIRPDEPSSQTPLGPVTVPAEGPAFATISGFDFWHQPPGTWKERSHPKPLLLLILSKVTALLTTRSLNREAERKPIGREKIWLIPANTPFAAHWHSAVSIVCLELPPNEIPFSEPRIIRLVDLIRSDWHLARMVADGEEHGPYGPVETRIQAIQLARYVAAVLRDNENHWREDGLSTERFRATTDFIEEHLNQKLSREALARADGQSLHHFVRLFKQRCGLTVREYISRRRCFRARELIESGVRLADAAAAVGFFDQSEMCNKFNATFGSPPSTFIPGGPI